MYGALKMTLKAVKKLLYNSYLLEWVGISDLEISKIYFYQNYDIIMISYRFAGRLTPAAKVEVHVITHSVPSWYAASISFLSSDVRPEL